MKSLRICSPLPEDVEELVRVVIGSCITVHETLGPGLLESSYAKALASELRARLVPFELELTVPVLYRGHTLGRHRIDLFVDGKVVVEVKAVERLAPVHVAQVLTYLRLTRARIGLLVNFNADQIRHGIRRVIL